MKASLAQFFDAMVPFVMGQAGVGELESRLGPSPSGRRQLEVYAAVVPANLRVHMEAMFPSVKVAADGVNPELWRRLVDGLIVEHPPCHGDPNHFGGPFAAFLTARRGAGDALPLYLEELADYHAIRWLALTSQQLGPDHTTFLRHYQHDVVAFARAVSHDSDPIRVPRQMATTVIVYRSPTTGRPAVLRPTAAQLLAYGRCFEPLEPRWMQAAGLTDADLDRAKTALIASGVINGEVSE